MICPQDICISPVGKMIEVKFLQPMRAIGRKQEPKTTKQILQSYNITFELSKQHINSLLFSFEKKYKNNHLNVDCYSKNQGKNRAIPELEPSNLLLLLFLNLFPRLILFLKARLARELKSMQFQDFTLDMYFRQFWQDPRLSFSEPGLEKLVVGAEYIKLIWVPDTFFVNEKSAYFHDATTENQFLRILHTGEILRSIR